MKLFNNYNRMQGGLFGLNEYQKYFLYFCQLVPTVIVFMFPDLIQSLLLTQLFYLTTTYLYIKFFSIQKSFYPYTINELNKLKWQIHKGFILGFSAFLLITIYGVIFLKIGRFVLPASVNLGTRFHAQWWAFLLLCLVNPILQQWFWRLFLPKTFQETYYRSHMTNITYLVYHFALFSRYVGFFRALPLVGTFFSVGRSMSHIKQKYGIFSSIVTHYGISFGGFALYIYIKLSTQMIL